MAPYRPPGSQQEHQGLWATVEKGDAQAVAAALATLATSRAAPPGPPQVAALLELAHPGTPPAVSLPALTVLSRWARQQSLQPAAARQAALLQRTVAAAQELLSKATGSPEHARLVAACLLLLGSTAPAVAEAGADTLEAITEAAGGVLLAGRLGSPKPDTAADALVAVGSLLPCLLGKPVAACWVLSALLQWLGSCPPTEPDCLAIDCLAPAYSMMRGTATAALSRWQPRAAVAGLLRPAYAVLKIAALTGTSNGHAVLTQAAVAVLVIGGLAEALLRSAPGFAEAAELAAEGEACLVQACSLAAAAGPAAEASLLRDTCSLAAVQLTAAVRRPTLVAAAGVARCQAQSLLHSALSLAPLCHAADALQPPAQVGALLRNQLSYAVAQHAGSMASTIAVAYAHLDAITQRWLLQQVQAAARQAHQQYRHYSLSPPLDWLAAIDVAAVRQLLDKLFLSCLVLLAAAVEAVGRVPPPTAPTAPVVPAPMQPTQLAALVAGVLADLQFCRLSSPPQYAMLLQAALAELPGDAAATATLVACLPCYAELAAACPARGSQAAWLVDGAAAAKAQFLMCMLTPCCSALPQSTLEERLAPLAFLYLLHPHPPTATAAHNLLCALLVALPEERRPPLAAYYVQRCLEGCPSATPLPQLSQGLATVMQALPVGNPVALLCLHRVLAKCWEVAVRGDPSAPRLASLAAQQLLVIDHLQLDGAMAAFDALLHMPGDGIPICRTPATPADGEAAATALLRREVLAAVQRTDDSLRKPVLAAWLLRGGGS